MKKALYRITVENTAGLSQSNEIILMDVFTKVSKLGEHKPHLLILTQKYVLYYENHTKVRVKRLMAIDFTCKFYIIKDQMGRPSGIRFERENCKPYELWAADPLVVTSWYKYLEKCMNKRGFHEEFKPIKKIGKGNFAAVYLAVKAIDGSRVAVKAFSKYHVFSQEKGRYSLINEIKLLRSFRHPNILRLLGVYESLNSVYLVLYYLEGSLLFNVIETHHFTLKYIQDIMRGLISGVNELAKKNVVHRDIKPENVMFRTSSINSDIVLLDFGLSTFCDYKEYIYTRCGTPGFVSPYIVNIKDMSTKCNPISDVFSLGVILHFLLIGKSPFKGKNFNEVLAENRQCSFTLQGPYYALLPAYAYDLMRKMLEKVPEKRISAEEALKHSFFVEPMEIYYFESSVKNPYELRILGSSIPEDSYGKFVMKKPCTKIVGNPADSIQIKYSSQGRVFVSPRISKFLVQSKSPGRTNENMPPNYR